MAVKVIMAIALIVVLLGIGTHIGHTSLTFPTPVGQEDRYELHTR